MAESRNKPRNRNEQRKARQLAAELGMKYTAALRMVRQETAERPAQAAQDAGHPAIASTANTGQTAAGTAPRFLAPHPTPGPNGAGR